MFGLTGEALANRVRAAATSATARALTEIRPVDPTGTTPVFGLTGEALANRVRAAATSATARALTEIRPVDPTGTTPVFGLTGEALANRVRAAVQLGCSDSPERRWPTGSSATARALTEIRPVRPNRYNWGVRTHRRGAGQPGPSRCLLISSVTARALTEIRPVRPKRYNWGVRTHRRGAGQPGPSRCLLISSVTARALTEIRPVRPKRYNWGVRTHRRGAGQPGPSRCLLISSVTARALTEIRPVRPKRYNWGVRTHRRGAGQPGPSRCTRRRPRGWIHRPDRHVAEDGRRRSAQRSSTAPRPLEARRHDRPLHAGRGGMRSPAVAELRLPWRKNNNPGPADAGPFLIRRAAPRPKTMPDHPKCPRPPIGAKPEEPPLI